MTKTLSISTKWVVEIYPFENPNPASSDFTTPSVLKTKITSVVTSKISKKLSDKLISNILPTNSNIKSYGITDVSISRSKGSPAGECSFTVVGPLPEDMIRGSWVIISSLSKPTSDELKYLMRFIGQIYAVDINYNIDDNGLKTTQTTVRIREWSFALNSPVRYDILSFESQILKPDALLQRAALASFGKLSNSDNPSTQLADLVSKSWDPYEMGSIILQLVGAIKAEDIIPSAAKKHLQALPGKAVSMPSIPQEVLSRLGFNDADPTFPFTSGFVKTITGNLLNSTHASGDWDGIWDGVINIDFLADIMLKSATLPQYAVNRPKVQGAATMLQQGLSAWAMLNQFCENSLNEVFTDIWYEKGSSGNIIGRPVIVLRDKPFLLKALRDNPPAELGDVPDLSGWTLYDNLPRLSVPEVQIKNFRINNNLVNSPNYIRADYQIPTGTRFEDASAALAGIVRLGNEIERFGGNQDSVVVTFFGLNSESSSNPVANLVPSSYVTYFGIAKSLFTLWHAYDYRMANGVLVLKDDNLPISIGLNVQFKMGNYTLVGHVDKIQYEYKVYPNGQEESMSYVTLSRICKVEENGSIGFIPPEDFGNLYYAQPRPGTELPGGGAKLIAGVKNLPDIGKRFFS